MAASRRRAEVEAMEGCPPNIPMMRDAERARHRAAFMVERGVEDLYEQFNTAYERASDAAECVFA